MSRMTRKGQVTIPKRIRDYLGLKPGSEVEFQYAGDGKFVVKTSEGKSIERERFEKALAALAGSAGPGMTTDEVMRLTRGWGEDDDVK
jgi:AbrB family looped-hinge helix DNA binding protein